jgi:hypothetical protein
MAPDPAWFEAEKAITFGGWRVVADRAPGRTVRIKGSTHLSFMDVPFLPAAGDAPAKAMLAATRIEPERMGRITSDLVLAFFAEQLGGGAAPLADPTVSYPEVVEGAP